MSWFDKLKKGKRSEKPSTSTPVELVSIECQYIRAKPRDPAAGEFDDLQEAVAEFLGTTSFRLKGDIAVAPDGRGHTVMLNGSCPTVAEAAQLQRKFMAIMERHGLLVLRNVDGRLDGFDGTPRPIRVDENELSSHWKCPRCHTVYRKKGHVEFASFVLKMGGKVEGTAKCMSCGFVAPAADIASGKYDMQPERT